MVLSESQTKVVIDCPLGDVLYLFIPKLHRSRELQQSQQSQQPQRSQEALRDDIVTFLGVLLSSNAAYNLRLSDNVNVADRLSDIQKQTRGGSRSLSHFHPLIDAAERFIVKKYLEDEVDKSLDDDVDSSLADVDKSLDTHISLTPPLGSIIKTGLGTPVKLSSNPLGNSEAHEIFDEIKDCTHRGVPGFFEKHFDSTQWTEKQQKMLKSILTSHDGAKWRNFPIDPWESHVWEWLIKLEEKALAGASYTLHSNKTVTEFTSRKGQMDIFLQKPQKPTGRRFEYKHVLVVGEHKRSLNTGDFKACLLQLTRHVRSMFGDQPMRRFVHAFIIKATTMELWVFDRSGAYSSGEFDIHHEPIKCATALVAYATMDDESMGLDRFIEWKKATAI